MKKLLISLILIVFLTSSVLGEKILVAVAHQDDETIGASGLMQRHVRNNDEVKVLIFTDGAPEEYNLTENMTIIRNEETINALKIINVSDIEFLEYDDLNFFLEMSKEEINNLIEELTVKYGSYDRIYTHAYEHGHIDHDSVSFIMSKVKGNFQLIEFQEYSYKGFNKTINSFNILNMTNEELDIKKEMLCTYKSQELSKNCTDCCGSILETYYIGKDKYKDFSYLDYTKSPCKFNLCKWRNHKLGWGKFYSKVKEIEGNWFQRMFKRIFGK